MRRKILITGATGFVGRSLLRRLSIDGNYDVFTTVRKKSGLPNEIVLDLCDDSFGGILYNFPRVDVVVHLGAKIGWDGSPKSALFVPNVLATSQLVNWANKIGAYFVFASAAIVCGAKSPCIDSESVPNPDTAYGYSKWLAEEMIRMSGIRHAILRISGIFGKNGPGHLGLNRAITNALKGETPFLYGSGKIRRNYIYVEDLADVILYCLNKNVEGTHLAAGSHTYTIAEMMQILCNVMLSGMQPIQHEGEEGEDQLVENSQYLPKGRPFDSAINDLKGCAI